MSIYNEKPSKHGKPYTPFYYIIGWSQLDRWYVGARTADRKRATAHPDELMDTYFTSSYNYVWPFMDQNGLPDVVWTFPCKTEQEAHAGETRIMNEFNNFLPDERWLNKSDSAQNQSVRKYEFNGMSLSLLEWSKKVGIKKHTLNRRLKLGWTLEEALTIQTLSRDKYR